MKKHSLFFVCISLLFVSCASLQEDIRISTPKDEEMLVVASIEEKVIELDAQSMQGTMIKATAEQLLKEIKLKLEDKNISAAVQANLLALQGRVNLLINRKSSAELDYQNSQNIYKGEIQGIILGYRLGKIQDLDKIALPKNQKAYVLLEKALKSYTEENYIQSVAYFDEAFITLPDFYKKNYTPLRNKAWSLRGISTTTTKESAELLKQDSLTLGDMIQYIQQEGNLLYKYLGNFKLSEKEKLQKLKTAGLFYSVNSWTDVNNLIPSTPLTRILAARFLWNLYNDRRGTISASPKYAKAFMQTGSPIPDLPLNSPDFDAVIGCVEREILELPDGVHFQPDENIHPMELKAGLEKIGK